MPRSLLECNSLKEEKDEGERIESGISPFSLLLCPFLLAVALSILSMQHLKVLRSKPEYPFGEYDSSLPQTQY
jgi:hypothetical protein